MKTPMQELIEHLETWMLDDKEVQQNPTKYDERLVQYANQMEQVKEHFVRMCKSMLEKEKEFVTNFAIDYVFSGEVGCAMWGDGPPELDIDKNARDYYKEYINTTSFDSTEWSNTKEK